MRTLARSVYLDSQFGVEQELPHAGSALEHPLVFDDAARELKMMAEQGLIEIVGEHSAQRADEMLIDRLTFKRLR
jgi:hypothetical protein